MMPKTKLVSGFTLIEVLLALTVIAIALTALLKATAQNIDNTHRIKEKTISHWVAMQGVAMIQLNLLRTSQSQESTQATTMLGQKWYWRAKISPTPIKRMQQITISVSSKQAGPFREELSAFRYLP
ncbi:TPA: GspI family T2SS minor pseudopilin variant LspI [Legionella pneumophila]|uniref:Type II secretion system protein I n=1 Tax=Legionella pneumophila subsp. pneumophila TaxID=91891 RepID=A0AAV2UXD5_LEGPN|nr:GspI family T2SS minor pseudopilin variant LspI [Legionella pneumophila]MCK1850164.1 GspI family T2SS minor pseudopilin variant LspI [Legionella pneumophila]MCZ4806088.1 GspI family T2SS minor pseudopilin variant LspI [Legionella pneumophila]MDI9852977.1 GspI family T2SS minor pseudopilin variant LspI [Legionella pneumophila]MDW8855696.1 GspI family T2SS minor pseudopilin variant LspI [Legionella pneumophila]MDW8922957.1 GspI family T2SS minor pseudopilin variant LspI [Legionella pneumophil